MNRRYRGTRVFALCTVAVLTVAACGSSKKSSNTSQSPVSSGATQTTSGSAGTTTAAATSATSATTKGGASTTAAAAAGTSATTAGGAGTATAGDPLAQAKAATAQAIKSTNRHVDPTSRPAAKDKHVVVISSGEASLSSSIPSDAAVEAAKALGWKADLYDAKLNPANYGPLIRQAIAAGANGIVLDAIDCQAAKAPLQEAKAKGIVITSIYAFDCSDPLAGAEAKGLYDANVNFAGAEPGKLSESYGKDQANYVIANSENKAKVIVLEDDEFVVLKYTYKGFTDQIKASGGAEVVSTLQFTVADLASNLTAKVQAELLKHPDATWIKSPYTAATLAGVIPGLGDKAGKIKVMGGEGFQPELDLVRTGKIAAVNVISSDWTGWASIDAMNSVFNKTPTVDSGIGWTIVDKDHGLPASGNFIPAVDFKAEFKKAWGVA